MYMYILGLIILILCLIGIYLITKNEKIMLILYKINMCEKEMNSLLKNKEDLTLRIISIIEREIKREYKNFEEVKSLKSSEFDDILKDNILNSAYFDIIGIYESNGCLKDIKSFDGILKEIEDSESQLISLRTLYNKCAVEYNALYKKFPYLLISKLKKLDYKKLYSGKDLNDIIEKELNVTV